MYSHLPYLFKTYNNPMQCILSPPFHKFKKIELGDIRGMVV